MPRLTGQLTLMGEALGLANRAAQPLSASPDCGGDDFDALVRAYHRPVTRLAYRLLGWRGDVEDLVHDVFVAAFKQRDRFRGDASTWTWLAAIAINQSRSLRRRQLMRFRWMRRTRPAIESPAAGEDLERDETAQRVRDAVARLSATDRELIVLHYLESMSVEELCKLLKVTNKAIHVRLHRARNRLKELLESR